MTSRKCTFLSIHFPVLMSIVFAASVQHEILALEEGVIYYESFEDDVFDDVGLQLQLYDNWDSNATLSQENGDLIAESPTSWAMWGFRRYNGKGYRFRNQWSFRTEVTIDELDNFLAVGTTAYNHSGFKKDGDDFYLRAGSGGGRNTLGDVVDVFDGRLVLQMDMDAAKGEITASTWRPGDPASLVTHTHPYDLTTSLPAFGINTGKATFHEMWISREPIPISFVLGDFNADGVLDAHDLGELTAATQTGDSRYDVNSDEIVDSVDRTSWIKDLKNTWFGDSNLDGEFSSDDFVGVFQAGKYETGEAANWTEGDWDGDGIFSSGDFVTAFSDGGFEQGRRVATQTVPEPSSILIGLTGVLALLWRRR